jgi:hypothetical protein
VTNRDTPIPWGRYSTDQVEDLVAALLLREYPGGERMDGAGGDDGIDVLVPASGGIHVFEIKSYRERLKPAQKSAIEKSARTAAEKNLDMVAWTLVIPLDHTPAERRWMNQDLASGRRGAGGLDGAHPPGGRARAAPGSCPLLRAGQR